MPARAAKDVQVQDLDDPRLDPYRDLPSGRSEGVVVEGEVAVRRYLESDYPVRSVLTTEAHLRRLEPVISLPTEILVATKKVIEAVVGFEFHRGCLAHGPRPSGTSIEDQLPAIDRFCVVALEAVVDPVNVGAILRSARALGATGVLLDEACADPLSRRAVRASMGNAFLLPWWSAPDLGGTLSWLRTARGATLVAGSPEASATSLREWTPRPRTVLMVGNEGSGLSKPLLELADARLRIPIVSRADSLNVAAATAVLLYGTLPGQNP